MTEFLLSPALLAASVGAVVLAVASWTVSVVGLFSARVRVALRIVAGAAITLALLIIALRFVVLGG
ncbi:hypothetical protein FBY40_1195 [Microbacterium sp. SLBN-154]|uniref:hypothetical protein n=1 Tax=Microbacterium sp. SLBN-154 TaxID=2768458 RepID=UPI00114FF9C6|nr:hypothetical protein [Microbacterium sp. SLBN-154]TQK18706.1 hypothetical protein FBY40_1195 [Microbacterium sp. SLBN-154]